MEFKSKLTFLFLFVLFSLSVTISLARPSYQECQCFCQKQEESGRPKQQQQCQQHGRDSQQQCQQLCQQQQQKGQFQQCQNIVKNNSNKDKEGQGEIEQEYQECQRRCQQKGESGRPKQQQQCQQQCEQRQQQEQEQQQQQQHGRDPQQQCQQECQQQQAQQGQSQCQQRCEEQGGQGQQQQQRNNPYFLDEQSFQESITAQHGYVRVSPRFSQLSRLLRGIENYRIALFQANPSSFMIPHHIDAEAVFFVARGRGTINLVYQQNKESYNLEQGDVIRVPAGALFYLINRDNNDRFQMAALLQPVSTSPDTFTDFFPVGQNNPESYFNALSDDILEAAFNTPRDQLDRLFTQQNQHEFVRASQRQIRALTQGASSEQTSPRSRSRGPHNVFSQPPTSSNQYGQLNRVDANTYTQLQDLDLEVAYYDINKGAMLAPFYNSRATSLVVVLDGRGRFEMACPHLSSSQRQSQSHGEQQQQEGGSAHYQRVSARLSPQTAFIIPAGHPISILASDNQNLQIVAFKLNAQGNQRNYLAGQDNILNRLGRDAKELSFNMPAKEVEAILNNQSHSVFLPGPNQRQQQHA